MYDRLVDVPRLTYTYMIDEDLPHPMLLEAREALSAHDEPELGERFRTAGCCYYRDGRDSVAWHGDTIGRGNTHDTMVAIVSVGDPRRLALRPRGGGESIAVEMGHGDLVVMGGSCQRTWEHAVPRSPTPVRGCQCSSGRSTCSETSSDPRGTSGARELGQVEQAARPRDEVAAGASRPAVAAERPSQNPTCGACSCPSGAS